MGKKKKKIVLLCGVCGRKATEALFNIEPVCDTITCHVVVEEAVKSFIAENKNKK